MSLKNISKILLETLSDGEFHSGEQLGEQLGVSRAAVWKQLQKLEGLGLAVVSVRGKGYRLQQRIDFLSQSRVESLLSPTLSISPQLHSYDVLGSTNAHILRLLNQQSLDKAYCVSAEMQEAGRGRRGREWHSPFGQNLYFSLLWRFEQGMAMLDGLSLVVGLALLRALQKVSDKKFELKWPNDVLYQGKKLAGILLEVVGDPTGVCHVVMGVGVNVNSGKDTGETIIDQAWTSLYDIEGHKIDRERLLAETLNELLQALPLFEQQGFTAFAEQWAQYDAFYGQEVFVQLGDKAIYGIADGVSHTGELRLINHNGLQLFNGGEVSLRRKL